MSIFGSCKSIVVVAAHPDDEILGCGGTMARLAAGGADVHILVLGEGLTARHKADPGISTEMDRLRACGRKAAKIVNAQSIRFLDFPDNRFDTVAMLDIVKAVETRIDECAPGVVLTHSPGDLNVDHRVTAQAVMTATRPLPGSGVHSVYSFEVASSSEWNFGAVFAPNAFVDISDYLELKKRALSEYAGELRDYPHPRSLKGIEALASCRGSQCGYTYAEAFSLVRSME